MDKFCSKVKEGKNLEVLKKGKNWFQNNGANIVRYLFCDENNSRNGSALNEKDLKECSICGQNLYKIDEESRYINNEFESVRIVQKKHLIFVEDSGKKHYTCYGINRCFKRVGYTYDDSVKNEVNFQPPEFEEYFALFEDIDNLNAHFFESAKNSYENNVIPFVDKWFYKAINKKSVMEFISDFKVVDNNFLSLYCNKNLETYMNMKNKILEILGVKI